jgi:hypothetical protein
MTIIYKNLNTVMKKILPKIFLLLALSTALIPGLGIAADLTPACGTGEMPGMKSEFAFKGWGWVEGANGGKTTCQTYQSQAAAAEAFKRKHPQEPVEATKVGDCILTYPDGSKTQPFCSDEQGCKQSAIERCQNTSPAANTTYNLLAPLPSPNGMITTYEIGDTNQLSSYLNTALTIFIGICAVLAMIKIALAGLEYMTSELPGNKEDAKSGCLGAILGLVLALAAWPLLHQINPELLNADLKNLTDVTLFIEGPEMEVSGDAAKAICDKKVSVGGQTATSCAENEIVSVALMGTTVRVNKAIAADIQAVDTAWKNSTDPRVKSYKITQMGSYNARHAINSSTPSGHSFGLALDINSSRNPYSEITSQCTTDMPPAFVKLFTDRGFGWGGYWHSKKDTMHFSKLPNEKGYTSGTCAGLK